MSLIIVFLIIVSPHLLSSHTHASSSMHATSPPTSSSCTLRHKSQSAPQLLHHCPLNTLPHHSVGRNELASVQADWALFSRACSLLVACGLVRLRILARSRMHMHRVYKHVLSREETQAHADIAQDMAECQCQPQFGCRPAGRCCHRPRPPACPNPPTSARNSGRRSQLAMASQALASASPWPGRTQARLAVGPT